jgi:hypothetical protein
VKALKIKNELGVVLFLYLLGIVILFLLIKALHLFLYKKELVLGITCGILWFIAMAIFWIIVWKEYF